MYLENSTALELEVEGSKLSSIFKAWFAVKSIYNNRKNKNKQSPPSKTSPSKKKTINNKASPKSPTTLKLPKTLRK